MVLSWFALARKSCRIPCIRHCVKHRSCCVISYNLFDYREGRHAMSLLEYNLCLQLKGDQERNRNADLHKMLSSTQEEVTRLEELMGSLKQTIESLKLQSSVEEAKYVSALRKMAAEHEIGAEKRVSTISFAFSVYHTIDTQKVECGMELPPQKY